MAPKPERLVNLILLLQGRERGCSELAEMLEVSRRTVIRDVAALQRMGVPVDSRSGAQGGYSLPANASIKPLELTGSEAFLLMLALDALEQLSDSPFGVSRDTLMAKIGAILPCSQSEKARARLERVRFRAPFRPQKAPCLNTLVDLCGHVAEIQYDSEDSLRRIEFEIRRVYVDSGFWYVDGVAEGKTRTLRADRIQGVSKLDGAASSPEPLPYDHPSHPSVVVTLSRRGLRILEREPHMGHLAHGREAPFTLTFRCPPSELNWWAGYFGGMGKDAVVQGPPELIVLIVQRAQEQLKIYESMA